MSNLGKARAIVRLTRDLPGVDRDRRKKQTFDFTALNDYQAILASSELKPQNLFYLKNDAGTFAVLLPTPLYQSLDNLFSPATSELAANGNQPVWKNEPATQAGFNELPKELQSLLAAPTPFMDDYPPAPDNKNYKGPLWENVFQPKIYPHDKATKVVLDNPTNLAPAVPVPSSPAATPPARLANDTSWIHQHSIHPPGLWWRASTSNLKLPMNAPVWIDIERSEQRPAGNQSGFIVIRINPRKNPLVGIQPDGHPDYFDLVLPDEAPPILYDWGHNADNSNPFDAAEFKPMENRLSFQSIMKSHGRFRVGFLPIGKRLAIFFNATEASLEHKVYERPNPVGKQEQATATGQNAFNTPVKNTFGISEFDLQIRQVEVMGSNCAAKIQMGAMVFPTCQFDLSVDAALGSDDHANQDWSTGPGQNAFHLPFAGGNATNKYKQLGGSAGGADFSVDPTKAGHVGYGNIIWGRHPPTAGGGTPPQSQSMVVQMEPGYGRVTDNPADPSQTPLLPIGAPFLFRLRGEREYKATDPGYSPIDLPNVCNNLVPAGSFKDVSDDVMAVTETFQTSDRYHATHSLDLTLYNPDGEYNCLLDSTVGINVRLRWEKIGTSYTGTPQTSFVGATYGGFASEVAGKETVVIHCEDYMAILDHTLIINSPYYDGMDAFDAIYDLGLRAGITAVDDTDQNLRYYLPSGYSWLQPKMRFDTNSNLQEAMVKICELSERIIYFDGAGVLHLTEIQGGLLGSPTTVTSANHRFRRSPAPDGSLDDGNVIFDEKREEFKVGSAVNKILLRTVDLPSGSFVFVTRSAKPEQNRFPYIKTLYKQTPALASYQAANHWADMLQARVFQVPKGISFRTIEALELGSNDPAPLLPADIITVDDKLYRLMSLQRTYSAEENSLTTTVSGEWYGPQTP